MSGTGKGKAASGGASGGAGSEEPAPKWATALLTSFETMQSGIAALSTKVDALVRSNDEFNIRVDSVEKLCTSNTTAIKDLTARADKTDAEVAATKTLAETASAAASSTLERAAAAATASAAAEDSSRQALAALGNYKSDLTEAERRAYNSSASAAKLTYDEHAKHVAAEISKYSNQHKEAIAAAHKMTEGKIRELEKQLAEAKALIPPSSGAGASDAHTLARIEELSTNFAKLASRVEPLLGDESSPSPSAPFVPDIAEWPVDVADDPRTKTDKTVQASLIFISDTKEYLKHDGDDSAPMLCTIKAVKFLRKVRDYVASHDNKLPFNLAQYMTNAVCKVLVQHEEAVALERHNPASAAAPKPTIVESSNKTIEWIKAIETYVARNGQEIDTALAKASVWQPSNDTTVSEVNVLTALVQLHKNFEVAWRALSTETRADPSARATAVIAYVNTLPLALRKLVKQKLAISSRESVSPSMTLDKLKETTTTAIKTIFTSSMHNGDRATLIVAATSSTKDKSKRGGGTSGGTSGGASAGAGSGDTPSKSCSSCTARKGKIVYGHTADECRSKNKKGTSSATTTEPSSAHDDDARSTSSRASKPSRAHKSATVTADSGGDSAAEASTSTSGDKKRHGCPNCKYDTSKPSHSFKDCHIRACKMPKPCNRGDKCAFASTH